MLRIFLIGIILIWQTQHVIALESKLWGLKLYRIEPRCELKKEKKIGIKRDSRKEDSLGGKRKSRKVREIF